MQIDDRDREEIIRKIAQHLETGSPAERRYWWALYKGAIDGRSAAQVKKLEIEKGLYQSRAA